MMVDDQRTNRHLSQGRVRIKYMEQKFQAGSFLMRSGSGLWLEKELWKLE